VELFVGGEDVQLDSAFCVRGLRTRPTGNKGGGIRILSSSGVVG
jgi:hypothetical protein